MGWGGALTTGGAAAARARKKAGLGFEATIAPNTTDGFHRRRAGHMECGCRRRMAVVVFWCALSTIDPVLLSQGC